MSEQQSAILVKHVSARSEVARRPTSDVRIPQARDRWPVESFAASVRPFTVARQQAKASGVTLSDIQDFLSQGLEDGARRIGQRAHQRHQRAALLFMIRRT